LKTLFIFGTRPEAIKLAPLIKEFEKNNLDFKVCITAQHREMLDQVINFFDIKVDYDLDIMKQNQSLFELTANLIKRLEEVLNDYNPTLTIVQGDTTTAFVGALSSFYKKIKIAHIEAGLRSFEKYSPFPEEINRSLIGKLADFHFAPTSKTKENLLKEGIKNNVYVVGNTVIDALFLTLRLIKERGEDKYYEKYDFIDFSKKIILLTSHRRENWGKPLENICKAVLEIANTFKDIEIVFPVHLNPNVRNIVFKYLNGKNNIHLIEPLKYPDLVWLMSKSYLILTDSGGIQEEAPSLGKPVLVLRNVTERTEIIEAGCGKLVGTNKESIVKNVIKLLTDKNEYQKMSKAINPYGDGTTSKKIVRILKDIFSS